MKGKKIWMYISGGLLSLAALGGLLFFHSKPSASALEKPLAHYTLLSHNVGSIQTNPLEYTSLLRELSDAEIVEDEALRLAAKQLLRIDTEIKTLRCKHELAALEKALHQLLVAYYQWTVDDPPKIQVIKKEAETFLYSRLSNPKPKSYALPFRQDKFNDFDKKEVRALGGTRFSPLFYSKELLTWLKKNPQGFTTAAFAEQWLHSMKPYVEKLHKLLGDDDEEVKRLRENYLLTFLFDLHSLKRLVEHKGVESWVTLTEKLEGSILGERKYRNESLTTLYREQKPDIICLQECDPSLLEVLMKEGYCTPQYTGDDSIALAESCSVILYRTALFQRKSITVLSLDREDIGLPKEEIRDWLHPKIAVHKVYHRGMIWLVSSLHASSDGSNTLALLKALFALKKRIEEEEGEKVLLLLGMDANTSDQSKVVKAKLKADLKDVDTLLEDYKGDYKRIQHQGEHVDTVHKERSTFQMQLRKAHAPILGISDFILVSNQVSLSAYGKEYTLIQERTYLGPYGPSLKHNPSDHSAVVLTFTLQESEETPQ